MFNLNGASIVSEWWPDVEDVQCAGDADEDGVFCKVTSRADHTAMAGMDEDLSYMQGILMNHSPPTKPERKGSRVAYFRVYLPVLDETVWVESLWVGIIFGVV